MQNVFFHQQAFVFWVAMLEPSFTRRIRRDGVIKNIAIQNLSAELSAGLDCIISFCGYLQILQSFQTHE